MATDLEKMEMAKYSKRTSDISVFQFYPNASYAVVAEFRLLSWTVREL